MSKPLGYYFDPALDRAGKLTPFQDWLSCTAIVTVLAGTFGWMLPLSLVCWWIWPNPDDAEEFFGRIYLTCVGVWVIPSSVAFAFVIWRDARYKKTLEAVQP